MVPMWSFMELCGPSCRMRTFNTRSTFWTFMQVQNVDLYIGTKIGTYAQGPNCRDQNVRSLEDPNRSMVMFCIRSIFSQWINDNKEKQSGAGGMNSSTRILMFRRSGQVKQSGAGGMNSSTRIPIRARDSCTSRSWIHLPRIRLRPEIVIYQR